MHANGAVRIILISWSNVCGVLLQQQQQQPERSTIVFA